jgi:nitrogen regulatory protein P-II 2
MDVVCVALFREALLMQLHTLKKVTIVIEDTLKNQVVKKICELGATGYTCHEVQGFGNRGSRSDPFTSNNEITVICQDSVANSILKHVADNYFENHACIAWLSDVQVVRGARYLTPGS